MKALVFHGPGQKAWEDKPMPKIHQPTDAVVKISTTTICGTDLHILRGHVPAVTDGRILGHEGIGIVEEIGGAVSNVQKGDKVLIPAITSCGRCDYCKQGVYSHCRNGGWILGHKIDGTQAEYVRIPYADTSLYKLDQGVNEEALIMLADILPTGFEIGIKKGNVQPGKTVAVVGAGPIGLAAILTASLYGPSEIIAVDLDDNRLDVAKRFGATTTFNSGDGKAAKRILDQTGGEGVDVAIEAVGVAATFDLCQAIVRAGGNIAVVGVHGSPVQFQLDRLWIENITLTTGLVDTFTIPMLLKMVLAGKLEPEKFVTHRFSLQDTMKAYDTFANAAKEKTLKVLLQA